MWREYKADTVVRERESLVACSWDRSSVCWGHGGAVASAVASQLKGPGFKTSRGKLWALVACLLLCVTVPTPRVGLTKGPFCVEFACSPRVP